MDKPQILIHAEKAVKYTANGCNWLPKSKRLITYGSHANRSGALEVYDLDNGKLVLMQEATKASEIRCGTVNHSFQSHRSLATGDAAGNMMSWDVERLGGAPVYQCKAHDKIVMSIAGCASGGGPPEIVTGSDDGTVRVWDTRQADKPVVDMVVEEGETPRACWAVNFGNSYSADERSVVAGYDNGDVKLFDLRTMSVRWETNVPSGVCSVEFDRQDIEMNKLLVTGLDSLVHVYDMRCEHPSRGFASVRAPVVTGATGTVWFGRHLPQNREVFMTSTRGVTLWRYRYPTKRTADDDEGVPYGVAGTLDCVQSMVMGQQPVSAFDWSPDFAGLAACTALDQTVRVLLVSKLTQLQ